MHHQHKKRIVYETTGTPSQYKNVPAEELQIMNPSHMGADRNKAKVAVHQINYVYVMFTRNV